MPRAPTRSQRASRSQPGPSQSQRGRRDEDEEDAEENGAYDEDEDMNGGHEEDAGDSDIKRKANDLVRLAIFSEHRRLPLRRDEINKKVVGSGTRAFNAVFQAAQATLRDTFGMELAELHKHSEGDDTEEAQATGVKKRAATSGTKTYILRSTLHPAIIDHASLSDATILEEESADLPDPDEEDADGAHRAYGTVISWSGSDNLGALGILHVVLALILASGRLLSDADLRTHLRRLRLDPGAEVPVAAGAVNTKTLTIDAFLAHAQRQGYIDRLKVGDAGGAKKGGKRARGAAADDDNTQFEWRWGPRAHAEIGERGVGRFLAEFMAERAVAEEGAEEDQDQEEEEGDREHRSAALKARLAKVTKGIEQAAGGNLLEVR